MPAVFVYGTLLPGESRWAFLVPYATGVSDATAPGRLYDTGRGYPGAVFDPAGTGVIPGARVEVTAGRWRELIRILDDVEAEGTLYRRLDVETSAGPAVSYEWLGDTASLRELPHGWRARGLPPPRGDGD